MTLCRADRTEVVKAWRTISALLDPANSRVFSERLLRETEKGDMASCRAVLHDAASHTRVFGLTPCT